MLIWYVQPASNVGVSQFAHLIVDGKEIVVPELLVVNSTKYSFIMLLLETLPNIIVSEDKVVLVFL